jgi:hypothetical protein
MSLMPGSTRSARRREFKEDRQPLESRNRPAEWRTCGLRRGDRRRRHYVSKKRFCRMDFGHPKPQLSIDTAGAENETADAQSRSDPPIMPELATAPLI